MDTGSTGNVTSAKRKKKKALLARGRALAAKRARRSLPEEEDSTFNASLGPLAEAPGLPEPASISNDADFTTSMSLVGEDDDSDLESEDEDADFTEEKAEEILTDFLKTMPRCYRK